jgi:collagenase-like PrtC family protease
MRDKPELLAPAGGWNQLKAAVRFGADAVYLGCDKFGMRARATNFTLGEMPEVVAYAVVLSTVIVLLRGRGLPPHRA